MDYPRKICGAGCFFVCPYWKHIPLFMNPPCKIRGGISSAWPMLKAPCLFHGTSRRHPNKSRNASWASLVISPCLIQGPSPRNRRGRISPFWCLVNAPRVINGPSSRNREVGWGRFSLCSSCCSINLTSGPVWVVPNLFSKNPGDHVLLCDSGIMFFASPTNFDTLPAF